jgi:hypothetical protein
VQLSTLYLQRSAFRLFQGVNFAAVWEEYDRLRQLRGHADHYPWPMAIRAFETLLARGILTHADPRCAAGRVVIREDE